jgi:hypothetical protein
MSGLDHVGGRLMRLHFWRGAEPYDDFLMKATTYSSDFSACPLSKRDKQTDSAGILCVRPLNCLG